MTSVRQEIENLFGTTMNLSQGILASGWAPIFEQNRNLSPVIEDATPTVVSLRKWLDSLRWPSQFTKLTDYPDNVYTNYGDVTQGVASYQDRWIFSWYDGTGVGNDRNQLNIPVSSNLATSFSPVYTINDSDIPDAAWHPGDIAVVGDILIVPLDYGSGPFFAFFQLGTNSFDDFQYLDHVSLPGPQGAQIDALPWVAAYTDEGGSFPTRMTLLSSYFRNDPLEPFETGVGNVLFVYEVTVSGGTNFGISYQGTLELTETDGSPLDLRRIQGGTVSDAKHLYLTSDRTLAQGGGIYGFDLSSGRKIEYLPLDANNWFAYYELEGVTALNVTPLSRPTPLNGQLHATVFRGNPSRSMSMLHWSVPTGEEELV